jgi:hypothetical protein
MNLDNQIHMGNYPRLVFSNVVLLYGFGFTFNQINMPILNHKIKI